MPKELLQLIESSGDATLEGYAYSGGLLVLELSLDEPEQTVTLRIRTDVLSVNNFYASHTEPAFRVCMMQLETLADVLSTEHDIYLPATDFVSVMKQTKLKYHLAYGRKVQEVKYLFSLVGYDRIVSCLLSDWNCVTIEGFSP